MLLAAITGAITGLFVRFFEYVVVEVAFERIVHGPLWVGADRSRNRAGASAILLHTVGNGASSATSDEYLRAFHDPEYPLRPRAFMGRMAAAVTTLGSGGAMGLEGPSMYGGSALGAMIQRRLPKAFRGVDHRTLLVAGAAAGVAAIFKAPATGAIFALEVPFRDQMARRMLLPALVASASGYLVFVALSTTDPIFSFQTDRAATFEYKDLAGAILIGIFCAVGARGLLPTDPLRQGVHLPADRRAGSAGGRAPGGAVRDQPGPDRREPHHRHGLRGDPMAGGGTRAVVARGGVRACDASPRRRRSPVAGSAGCSFRSWSVEPSSGRGVGDIVNPLDPTLYVLLGIAAFLGAGYRVPLAAVMFVAEATGQPGFIVPALFAAVAAELVMGEQSITTFQRSPDRAG